MVCNAMYKLRILMVTYERQYSNHVHVKLTYPTVILTLDYVNSDLVSLIICMASYHSRDSLCSLCIQYK